MGVLRTLLKLSGTPTSILPRRGGGNKKSADGTSARRRVDCVWRLDKRRIIDADGHVAEDAAAIIARMPQAYRDKAREQPFNPFPPFDHLHAGHLVDMPPGAFNRKVGPKEWLAFLDEVGIEATVLYPTAGVASANIVNPDWAIDATRAYNDWLHETYLKPSPRFRGLALLPQACIESAGCGR